MNIKKIIPLSLATMSMMGAFTACSDNKVVGADEQTNTMAETILNKDVQRVMVAKLNEAPKSNAATTIVLDRDSSLKLVTLETFDGDEIYNNAKNQMINMDSIDTAYENAEGWSYYQFRDGVRSYYKGDRFYSMRDENGVLHGPIALSQSVFEYSIFEYSNTIGCANENKWLRLDDEIYDFGDHYAFTVYPGYELVHMQLRTRDSLMMAQFIEDCIAADGKIEKEGSGIFANGSESVTHLYPRLNCSLKRDNLYKDPYWEKYASFIVNSCRSDIESSDHIPVVPCPENKCTGVGVEYY
jgi:hypothetical protein